MIYWPPMVILRKELPLIQKIKRDERWLASEKRGYDVGDQDPEVELNICSIIKEIGNKMRREAEFLLEQSTRPEYRLVRHMNPSNEEMLTIHRVFCESDGTVCGICATPHIPCGINKESVLSQIKEMSSALNANIINEEDFPFADWSLSKRILPGT